MKRKAVNRQEVIKLIYDGCGLEASDDEGYELSEFITIEHICCYGAIHGYGKQISIDLCQHCLADICGDTLTIFKDNSLQSSIDEKMLIKEKAYIIIRTKHCNKSV